MKIYSERDLETPGLRRTIAVMPDGAIRVAFAFNGAPAGGCCFFRSERVALARAVQVARDSASLDWIHVHDIPLPNGAAIQVMASSARVGFRGRTPAGHYRRTTSLVGVELDALDRALSDLGVALRQRQTFQTLRGTHNG